MRVTADENQDGAAPYPAEQGAIRTSVPTGRTSPGLLVSMALVWVAAAVGVLLVALLAPAPVRTEWLAMVFAATVVLTFLIQLIIQRAKGFLHRVTVSTLGSLLVLAAGTLILELMPGSG